LLSDCGFFEHAGKLLSEVLHVITQFHDRKDAFNLIVYFLASKFLLPLTRTMGHGPAYHTADSHEQLLQYKSIDELNIINRRPQPALSLLRRRSAVGSMDGNLPRMHSDDRLQLLLRQQSLPFVYPVLGRHLRRNPSITTRCPTAR
jgi:hypothetical protein